MLIVCDSAVSGRFENPLTMLLDWKQLPRLLLKIKSMQVSRDWGYPQGDFNKLISITQQLGCKTTNDQKYGQREPLQKMAF